MYWRMLGELAARAGFTPRIAHELDSLSITQAFVAAGHGVALMNELTLARPPRPDIAVRPLAGTRVMRRVWAATVRGRRHPPASAMAEILLASSA